MKATPMAPFGARVDVDLRTPLDSAQQKSLCDLFYAHKLLFFPGQQLSMDDQRRVMGYIGPLDPDNHHNAYVKPDDGILNAAELHFHSDMGFVRHPCEGISLHAVDVEEELSYTAFVNAIDGFARLPKDLADRMRGATTERVATYTKGADDVPPHDTPPGMSSVMREAVIPHYKTGEPILYVARASTARVVGLAQPESRALLDAVLKVLYDEAHIYRHHWRNGDLVIWDNMALQHARPALKKGVRRILQRVMVATHPQRAQMPADYVAPAKTYAPAAP